MKLMKRKRELDLLETNEKKQINNKDVYNNYNIPYYLMSNIMIYHIPTTFWNDPEFILSINPSYFTNIYLVNEIDRSVLFDLQIAKHLCAKENLNRIYAYRLLPKVTRENEEIIKLMNK